MNDEQWQEPLEHSGGDESERILEDTYLTGGVGMASPPRIAASKLHDEGDEGLLVSKDSSWESHAIEEGDPGDAPPLKRSLFKRLFGG